MTQWIWKSGAAMVLALVLAGCASDQAPPAPPPAPAPVPPVSLSSDIADSASVYMAYVTQARSLRADYQDGATVQMALQKGATFEARQLARGAVAYGAITALQSVEFRRNLDTVRANPEARDALIRQIYANPASAAGLPGAETAAHEVIDALSRDGDQIFQAGARIKQSAYDIQKQAWARETIAGRDERLTRTKLNSSQPASVDQDRSSQMMKAALKGDGLDAVSAGSGLTPGSGTVSSAEPTAQAALPMVPETSIFRNGFDRTGIYQVPYTQTVKNALAIAALAMLGAGDGDHAPVLSQLLDDGVGANCLGLTKLNLYQCLAVAKPNYEDVFCIGQHELMDTGSCLGRLASARISDQEASAAQALVDKHGDAHAYITPPGPTKTKSKKSHARAARHKRH